MLQGMVEKWLLQVEDVMLNSIKKEITKSVEAYKHTIRERWVLDWPGQVILATSSIYWTSEVAEAMKHQGGVHVRISLYVILTLCKMIISEMACIINS